jgi:hypothetical protein
MIPLVGSPAAELFNMIVTPPLERRRDAWREEVGQQLQGLIKAGFITVDELGSNETFVSTLMQATAAAVKNHQAEKRESLRNAVINAALPTSPDESLQQMFVHFVDSFTIWHIRILKLFHDVRAWQRSSSHSPNFLDKCNLERVLLAAYPELRGRRDFYVLVVKDLNDAGLMYVSLESDLPIDQAYESRTTKIGAQFISFISELQKK